jgi:hypothetical protein
MSIEKKNSANIGQAEGHNARHHQTRSQAPEAAWLTDKGHHTLKKWDGDLLAKSKELAKRKDAVFAVELIVQVGNQTDWRDLPTAEHPHGPRKPGNTKKMNALIEGVRAAALSEFGADRIISMEMHTDESTPHVHIIFAPILDGKLNAKHWTGGAARCAQLRERIYEKVNQHIACEYTKGEPGGAPHDPMKAAGKPKAPNAGEVASLKSTIEKLNQQVQTLFSQLKSEQKKARKEKAEHDDFVEKAMLKFRAYEQKIRSLLPTPAPEVKKAPVEAKNGVPGVLGVLSDDRKSPPTMPRVVKPR